MPHIGEVITGRTGRGRPMMSIGPTLEGPVVVVPTAGNVASGGTITLTDADAIYINVGTGTKASLTFNLPTSPKNGQRHRIMTDGAITAVTVSGGAISVSGAPTTLAADEFCEFVYLSSQNLWYRFG